MRGPNIEKIKLQPKKQDFFFSDNVLLDSLLALIMLLHNLNHRSFTDSFNILPSTTFLSSQAHSKDRVVTGVALVNPCILLALDLWVHNSFYIGGGKGSPLCTQMMS